MTWSCDSLNFWGIKNHHTLVIGVLSSADLLYPMVIVISNKFSNNFLGNISTDILFVVWPDAIFLGPGFFHIPCFLGVRMVFFRKRAHIFLASSGKKSSRLNWSVSYIDFILDNWAFVNFQNLIIGNIRIFQLR